MTTPAAAALDRLARISQLAQDLADALAAHAAIAQDAIAFSDSRVARRMAGHYSPQMRIDERYEHPDERHG